MQIELLFLTIIVGILGLIIYYLNNIGEDYPQIWNITATYVVIVFILEQLFILLLDIDVKELSSDFVIGIWLYNISIESFIAYFTVPFFVMNIYYAFIKS